MPFDKITIFWFRRDLRFEDNRGLYYALIKMIFNAIFTQYCRTCIWPPWHGSLINYFGLKHINAMPSQGKSSSPQMQGNVRHGMAAVAYNLKKYLRFLKPGKAGVQQLVMRQQITHFSLSGLDQI